jgi:hypothetical protein
MTTRITHEVASRRAGRERRARLTLDDDLCEALELELEASVRVRFPSDRYRADPVAFFREILGVDPWSKQVEILEAIRDCPRVAVKSGHKVGKSHSIAGIALWFYCSFEDARAVLTSTTSRQVDQILWRELSMMRSRGGRCLACKLEDPEGHRITKPCPHSALIDGDLGMLARTGLKSEDFREIVGFTAREAEAVAGISGRNLLYLPDEASGIAQAIFEAMEGNRAGGARLAMFSNPTRNEGEFYDAFHSKSGLYKTITISSEESPNVQAGRIVVPGLAERSWIEEKKIEWGEQSPLYAVRVKGEFAEREEGKIFSIHAITAAEQRWSETPDAGRLYIGVDPAGESGTGDDSAFAVRRGLKVIMLRRLIGLNEDQHLVQILSLIKTYALPRETPVVVLDREGSIGSSLAGKLRGFVDTPAPAFEFVGVRASDRAARNPAIYDRARDELVANVEAWMRDGGALPEDSKLEQEMHAFEWRQAVNGRLKVTPKDVIKKMIGRSPDGFDAVALSCWEPLSLQGESLPESARTVVAQESEAAEVTMDPYAAGDAWKGNK